MAAKKIPRSKPTFSVRWSCVCVTASLVGAPVLGEIVGNAVSVGNRVGPKVRLVNGTFSTVGESVGESVKKELDGAAVGPGTHELQHEMASE